MALVITRSMHSAMVDLRLSALTLVHAGDDSFSLAKRVRALSWKAVVEW